MRIRKRKVPLPISLLSPVPLPDPHLFSRSPVTTSHDSRSQPLDHLTCDLHRFMEGENSNSHRHHHQSDPLVKELLVGCCLGFKLAPESMPIKSNDASNVGLTALGATAASHDPSPLSNHGGRAMWCDEDRDIPLKKRRGSFEGASAIVDLKSETNEEKELEINLTTNEEINDCSEREHNNNAKSNNNGVVNAKKGVKRGNTIMEGSRCSRVNGRGWRCCQSTLVGYSLCEHHLGKGRLRSMTNTSGRGRPSSVSKKPVALGVSTGIESSPLLQLCEAAKKESEALASSEKKASTMVRSSAVGKRVKLGVVKARSLSSLLGQTNTTSNNNTTSE